MVIWPSHQSPHELKLFSARVTGAAENQVHVRMGDVGGSFGQEMYPARDEAAIMLAAHHLRLPVKWVEDRRENLISANQARAWNVPT